MGSITTPRPLKIAILINTDEVPYISLFKSAYTTLFSTLSPKSTINFYSPPSHSLPSPSELPSYDLVVIGGGTYVVDEDTPWVVEELEFMKRMVKEYQDMKIVAICFGHQKLCQALGGELGWNKAGKAEVSGHHHPPSHSCWDKFFPFTTAPSTLKLHELHRKEISTPAPRFVALAENNQICLSANGRILTFQGHPEMSFELTKRLMQSESLYTKGLSVEELAILKEGASGVHDGLGVWRRILEWVRE
ncbi:class I glutamine amidotransferase-like protein [Stipitochalara longipes BDJ]|nr:class I glutamine amidotransferase-like protein [Stipitochalara longipes BDJ]